MFSQLIIIGLVAMLLAFIVLAAFAAYRAGRAKGIYLVGMANIAEGTRQGGITKFTDAAHTLRFLLVKFGSDANHVAIAGAADTPWGVCTDEAAAAEEEVNAQPLACCQGTIKLVNDATGALAVGDLVVPAASGKTKKIAAGAGNYYVVGMVVQAATSDGDVYEAIPIGAWKTQ
jgi:hypothetical protein